MGDSLVLARLTPPPPPCRSRLEESAGGSPTQGRATGSLCHPKRASPTSPFLHGERGRGPAGVRSAFWTMYEGPPVSGCRAPGQAPV